MLEIQTRDRAEDELLPIAALADLVFCERRAALHHLERLWEDNLFTVEGSQLHEKVGAGQPVEARGDLRIARGSRLRSLRLGLTGIADVVEFHRVDARSTPAGAGPLDGITAGIPLAGCPGVWVPLPVEYKRGRLRREEGYEVQLCAQALCLEEMLSVVVPCGAVFYGQPRRRLEVVFSNDLRCATDEAASRLHRLVAERRTPPARYEAKCESCSLIELCMPRALSSRRGARHYLSNALADARREGGESE